MSQREIMIITGASSGIGAATARLFGREGYPVVLAARRVERLEALAKEITASGGEAWPVSTDVTRMADIENLVAATLERYGRIDILFNNAGFGRLGWLETLDPEGDIAAQIQVNLIGLAQMTRAVLPHMIEQRSGHVINMASMAGWLATPTYSIYAAGKFGVRGFTEALRREVRVWGIHVSGIYPGGVKTEFSEKTGAQRRTGVTTPPALRLSADQVARAVLGLHKRPRRALIIPWPMRLAAWINFLAPGVVDWVIEQRFVRRERDV